MKQFLFYVFLLSISLNSFSQNVTRSQQIIDTLCSDYFHGRGYYNKGDVKASKYIANEFEKLGIDPYFEKTFFHNFGLNVNTFPGTVEMSTQTRKLVPGKEFIISPDAPDSKVNNQTVNLVDKKLLLDKKRFKKLLKLDWSKNIVLIDAFEHTEVTQKRYEQLIKKYTNPIWFRVAEKLTWSVSRVQNSETIITFLPEVLNDQDVISMSIEATLIKNYKTRNVVGKITGTEQPDSFVFITGHYDHLGRMGSNCVMPGANDNASGIAMILDLAKHYKENPPSYTIVFIAFAAEEAGLVGSYHFVQELPSLMSLDQIRFVVNMDLMGSGQEGIMAVNGAVFKEEYQLLESINTAKSYLPQTKKRGKAANSDHYFFTEAGVPAFFFYLMGPYSHYHDVDDTSENLRLEEKPYNGSFRLIRDFINALMHDVKD